MAFQSRSPSALRDDCRREKKNLLPDVGVSRLKPFEDPFVVFREESSGISSVPRIIIGNSRTCLLARRRRRQNQDDDLEDETVDLRSFFSRPTPGIPSLSLGFPATLLASALFLPLSTFGLTAGLFTAFAYGTRSFVNLGEDDDEDDDDIPFSLQDRLDFVAIIAAFLSAGILAPSPDDIVDSSNNLDSVFLPVVGIVVVTVPFVLELTSRNKGKSREREDNPTNPERVLMNLWDEELEQSTRNEE